MPLYRVGTSRLMHTQARSGDGQRRWLRLLAALPLPLLVALWALWRDVVVLDATGV